MLLSLAGLRPSEIEALRVVDYFPDRPALRTGAAARTIAIPATCAAAVTAFLAQEAAPDGFVLPDASVARQAHLVRCLAARSGADIDIDDLRHAAIHAALAGGIPGDWVIAYFGTQRIGPRQLAALPAGWDADVAAVVEKAFGD